MFKIAKSKYNRERPKRAGEEDKQSAMEDYELYLRSVNAKVKTANDKLANVQKQQRVNIIKHQVLHTMIIFRLFIFHL